MRATDLVSVRGAVEPLLQEREQRKKGLGPGGPLTDERRHEGDQNGPPCSASSVTKSGFQVKPNLDLTIAMLLCILLEEKQSCSTGLWGAYILVINDYRDGRCCENRGEAITFLFIRSQRSMSGLC